MFVGIQKPATFLLVRRIIVLAPVAVCNRDVVLSDDREPVGEYQGITLSLNQSIEEKYKEILGL
jgi:hypothetical protein